MISKERRQSSGLGDPSATDAGLGREVASMIHTQPSLRSSMTTVWRGPAILAQGAGETQYCFLDSGRARHT